MLRANPTFCERHQDPFTSKVLEKLSAKLAILGYEDFFEECIYSKFDDALKWLDQELKLHEEARNLLAHFGIDLFQIETNEDIAIAAEKISIQQKDTSAISLKKNNQFIKNNMRYKARMALYKLYEKLQTTNAIQLKGIDVESKDIAVRNDAMSDAFLNAEKSFFSRIGLEHALGVQRLLFAARGKKALEQFPFYYIYSGKSLTEMEDKARMGNSNYPLGMTVINAVDKSVDEAVDIIYKDLFEKNAALNLLPTDACPKLSKEEKPCLTEGILALSIWSSQTSLKPLIGLTQSSIKDKTESSPLLKG